MKRQFFTVFKYLLSFAFGAFLFWYLYQGIETDEILEIAAQADPLWVGLSIAASLISHWARGWRWAVALKPLSYQLTSFRAFLAVMTGYFVNMLVPRLGEFMRCGVVRRTDNIAVNHSFGAVIAERAIDLVILFLLVATLLLWEFSRLGNFVIDTFQEHRLGLTNKLIVLAIIGLLGLVFLFLLYVYREWLKQHVLYQKIQAFLLGIWQGVLAIKDLSPKSRVTYLFLTAVIWIMYFFMTYWLFFSYPETAAIGVPGAFAVMVMGGIVMSVPTPGGAGSYHLFVAYTFVSFGVNETLGRELALLTHGLNVLVLISVGALSLALSFLIPVNQENNPEPMTESAKAS